MGIAGLLPQLRSITNKAHVSKYRGQRVAIDAYCILHRASYCCARELVEGEPTDRHVQYCMARIDLLTSAGVVPVVVFDGGRLPNKADEERTRERNREENKARARSLWQQGNKAAAMECYQRAVDISPAHAKQFLEALKCRNIEYIVAPYEADAQMAYLALNGLVDAVITEDSDLLCYGCPTVFFKMDKSGEGEEVQLRDLPQAKELAFQGFGLELFQEMCVLAGCDFVASLPGIGIKKAHQHLRRTRCFLKVVRALRFDGTKIPEGYERRVQRALWTFKHQRVYCPRRRAVVHLHEVVGGDLAAGARVPAAAQLEDGEPDFLGPALPDDVAQGIAVGDLDPITKLPFSDDLQPCTAPLDVDAAAGGGRASQAAAAAMGRANPHQQPPSGRQHGSERGKSGAAVNGGNTLANYKGFLRGLAKPATGSEFRRPRAGSSPPGSQDSTGGSTVAALQREQGAPAQQQQQQEEDEQEEEQQQQRQQHSLHASPRASRPAAAGGGDMLASPTEDQWARFRQLRHRGSGRAPPAASQQPAKPAVPTTSSYFVQPKVAGVRRPSTGPKSGSSLLARLRAALQPEEPSIDELLAGSNEGAAQEPAAVAAASAVGCSDGQEGDAEDDNSEEQRQQRQQQGDSGGSSRQRFQVPHARQQPKTPLDLGLQSSPTIDDLLDDQTAAATAAAAAADVEAADEDFPVLDARLAEQPRPSLRLWMPQPLVQQQHEQQQQQEQVAQLDLVSPAGPAFLQQQQQQQQQQEEEGGVTPGFYMGGSSEAGSDVRQLTTLPRRQPAATPCSGSPRQLGQLQHAAYGQQQSADRAGAAASALHRSFDAALPGASASAGGQPELDSSPYASDPIASLRHLPAYQREAAAAVERAAQAAMTTAAHKAFQSLPAPPHLQMGSGAQQASQTEAEAGTCQDGEASPSGAAFAFAVAKRPLLPEPAMRPQLGSEKENKLLPLAGKRKKQRGDGPAGSQNPFAAFAFPSGPLP